LRQGSAPGGEDEENGITLPPLFLRLLKPGGRAAVIVPDGVLFGSSNAHKTLRRLLVEEQKLDAVISLPGGVFKPYAGVSTAILLFTKTNSGGTDNVWFYDVDADGMSLDDKRTELLPPEKLGPVPKVSLTADDHTKNNLPDILTRWRTLGFGVPALAGKSSELQHASKSSQPGDKAHSPPPRGGTPNTELIRPRTAQSFCVPKAEIAAQGYDLSLNRYKEVVHEEVAHRPPGEILKALGQLEAEIQHGMKELADMLK
jgi:type I restriction enzyme M protein